MRRSAVSNVADPARCTPGERSVERQPSPPCAGQRERHVHDPDERESSAIVAMIELPQARGLPIPATDRPNAHAACIWPLSAFFRRRRPPQAAAAGRRTAPPPHAAARRRRPPPHAAAGRTPPPAAAAARRTPPPAAAARRPSPPIPPRGPLDYRWRRGSMRSSTRKTAVLVAHVADTSALAATTNRVSPETRNRPANVR